MRGDRNAVPLGTGDLQAVDAALRAQACELIERLPSHVLVAILPVLDKYAKTQISIPLHNHLTDEQMLRVVNAIRGGW